MLLPWLGGVSRNLVCEQSRRIAVHRVGYQFPLAIAVHVAKNNIMGMSRSFAVQDVLGPVVLQRCAKLIPAESPLTVDVLAYDDFFVPVAVDIFKRNAYVEAAATHDTSF